MPDCTFELSVDREPRRDGDRFTVSMTPALEPGCTFQVIVDGQPLAHAGDGNGDIELRGIGATGQVRFEATTDEPHARIVFRLTCPECAETTAQALELGAAPGPWWERLLATLRGWLRMYLAAIAKLLKGLAENARGSRP